MNPDLDAVTIVLLAIVIAFFAIVFLVGLTAKINDFRHKLDYLNREIARTEGAEHEHWKREKRRLWLSLLPFYRRSRRFK